MLNKRGVITSAVVFEILILVVAIVAFSYLVGAQEPAIQGRTGAYAPQDFESRDGKIFDKRTGKQVNQLNGPGTVTPPAAVQPVRLVSGLIDRSTIQKYTWAIPKDNQKIFEITRPDGSKENIDTTELKWTGTYKQGETKVYTPDGAEVPENILSQLGFDPSKGRAVGSSSPSSGQGAKSNLGFTQGGIADNAVHALEILGLIQGVGRIFMDDEKNVNAFAFAASAGFFIGRSVTHLIKSGFGEDIFSLGIDTLKEKPALTGFIWGGGAALAIFLFMYKKDSEEQVTFQCFPWQPPKGGSRCEECNEQGILPCSLYQCKSLGQSCDLLNDEKSGKALCTYVNRLDVLQPIIKPWQDPLLRNHTYAPNNAIQPPDTGVKIIDKGNSQGCIKAFTPLSFGIEVSEPARCKVDTIATKNIDEMRFFFGGNSLFAYNHSMIMSLPGPNAINNESPTLQNDGEYNLFVKCIDANGNDNKANFVFNFCVEAGPDTTPPSIISTSIENGAPIGYNKTKVNLDVYVNEPSSCKWSIQDKPYADMEKTMSCSSSIFEMNAQMLYTCKTTLDGLKDRTVNKFYFRCEDQPKAAKNDRNVNSQSYEFSLVGTQPLLIDSLSPNGTIKDSTEPAKVVLEVKTSQGYDDGRASCYFSDKGFNQPDSFVLFGSSDSHINTQILSLAQGSYKYFIKCIDLGGNQDSGEISFNVEVDKNSPSVVRVYKDENFLKIVTNEEAECRYSIESCSYAFADGIKMTTIQETQHFADWNTNINYYIKCADTYGNQPSPSVCNIVARPTEINVVGG